MKDSMDRGMINNKKHFNHGSNAGGHIILPYLDVFLFSGEQTSVINTLKQNNDFRKSGVFNRVYIAIFYWIIVSLASILIYSYFVLAYVGGSIYYNVLFLLVLLLLLISPIYYLRSKRLVLPVVGIRVDGEITYVNHIKLNTVPLWSIKYKYTDQKNKQYTDDINIQTYDLEGVTPSVGDSLTVFYNPENPCENTVHTKKLLERSCISLSLYNEMKHIPFIRKA